MFLRLGLWYKWERKCFLLPNAPVKEDILLPTALKSEFKKAKKFTWHFSKPSSRVTRIFWMALSTLNNETLNVFLTSMIEKSQIISYLFLAFGCRAFWRHGSLFINENVEGKLIELFILLFIFLFNSDVIRLDKLLIKMRLKFSYTNVFKNFQLMFKRKHF